MNLETFRQWLRERGCFFDEREHERGGGHVTVTARREGKRSVLPAAGAHKDLDPTEVGRVVDELGLDPSELPRDQSRV